jgi:probable phosphoglycerate mutase
MPTLPPDSLVAYIDGGSRGNPGPAGFGVRVQTAGDALVDEFCESIGVATNNVAEYRGLLAALNWAAERGERRLHVRSDSELLVRQMRGDYRVKNPGLQALHRQARALVDRFERVTFEHVPRSENRDADRLANLAMDQAAEPPEVRGPRSEVVEGSTRGPRAEPLEGRTSDVGRRTRDDAPRSSRQHRLPFDDHLPDNLPHSSDSPGKSRRSRS